VDDIPLLDIFNQLTLLDMTVLAMLGILMAYFFFSNQMHVLMFLLVFSAASVSTTIPIITSIASLTRWLILPLLLAAGLIFSKVRISFGMLMFWGYVFLGFVSLFRADYFLWQFQRSILLVTVAIAIPFAYSNKDVKTYKLALIAISLAATVYSLINFIGLPSSLNDPVRYTGFAKSAPSMAATLGGVLPFTIWGAQNADSKWLKRICVLGFLLGTVTLIFSAQRAGTIAGVLGLIPLLLLNLNQRKTAIGSILLLALLGLIGYLLLMQSSTDRITFLLSRYALNSGLSNREFLWQKAISEIAINPLWGNGIGAAEKLISSSFHNAYLEIWYNTGFFGLIFFVISQLYFLFRTFYLWRQRTDPFAISISALSIGYVMGFLVLCLFESIGAGASNLNLILYLFLEVLVSNYAMSNGRISPSRAQPYLLNSDLRAVQQ
jgi:O-antigen ligase